MIDLKRKNGREGLRDRLRIKWIDCTCGEAVCFIGGGIIIAVMFFGGVFG